MIETAQAADFGLTCQRIPASTARFRRRQKRGADSQLPSSVRQTTDNVEAKLRAIAGIAVVFALMAVGTAEAGAVEAPGRYRGVERLAVGSNGSDPVVGATVIGSAQDQTSRGSLASFTPGLEHVDLFGDSLGYQAEPYLDTFFAWTHNYTLSNYTYGGTATCDWLSTMAVAVAERP